MSPHNQQPPWGKKKKPVSPEDLIATVLQKIRDAFGGRDFGQPQPGGDSGMDNQQPQRDTNFLPGASKVGLLIGAILLVQLVYASFFTIQPGEVGVLLRFGKYARTSDPGLHFKIPFVETLSKVDVESVRKEEFGFHTRMSGRTAGADRRDFDSEALMLTGDKNVIEVAWIVQYKVSDPFNFLFKVRDVAQAVRDASEQVTRRIVGNMDFDYVLGNREILAANARKELQDTLDVLEAGVNIVTLQLLDINPPDPVKPAFNEVNEADQDMKRLVNEAEEQYNRVIPKARGDAKRLVEEAHGYAVERVNSAKGETARFNSIVKEYVQTQEVTKRRMYLEAMQSILPGAEHIYVLDPKQQGLLPFLNLEGQKLPLSKNP